MYRDVVKAQRAHIKTLYGIGAILFLAALFNGAGWYAATRELPSIGVRPDLSRFATLRPGQYHPHEIYGFAQAIWQGLNRWPKDGQKEYAENLYRFQAYLTPDFYAEREADLKERARRGELTDVLGDESVRTYDAGARSSRPGRGILPKHDEIVTEVRAAFEQILPSETPLSAEQLSTVSAPGIQITLDLIKRLRRLPKAEAAIAAARLAEEVAMARTIERGLYAKRVLLSGRREPNIANSPARDEIDRAISELSEEIETLVFEADVRHKLVSHTARNVLLFGEQESSRSADTESSSEAETEILEKGAVSQ